MASIRDGNVRELLTSVVSGLSWGWWMFNQVLNEFMTHQDHIKNSWENFKQKKYTKKKRI